MEKTEYKVTQVEMHLSYVVNVYCDRCKRLILRRPGEYFDKSVIDRMKRDPDLDLVDWYRVVTGHHDWGNDSCESVETKDICENCIKAELIDYALRAGKSLNTEYIEVNHKFCHSLNEDAINMK